jgi:RNA polymerase sigma-70 factor (ECF subfamily)
MGSSSKFMGKVALGDQVSDRGKGKTRLYLVGSPPTGTDADLVEAWRRGEAQAPGALWNHFYPLIRRVLCRSLGPGHEVDDLVQEVFIRVFRKLSSLRDPAAAKSFVLSIANRVVQSELRMKWLRRWLGLSRDGLLPEGESIDPDHDAREALDRFYGILDRLNAKDRSAFVLRYIEGLELTDVASSLHISLATIKRRLPRVTRRVFALAKGDPLLAGYLIHGGEGVEHG